MNAPDQIIARLGLVPHPEGGHYVETWRDRPEGGGRGSGTAIYYLLRAGERSHWHRIDATEIWLFHAGDPLVLRLSEDGRTEHAVIMGPDIAAGQAAQVVVPPHVWQAAEPVGDWTLLSCTVAPAFEFDGFEMAPLGWNPGD
jgi:predicted cupin superfamily sugar epimerase